jgi:hypothetical protein
MRTAIPARRATAALAADDDEVAKDRTKEGAAVKADAMAIIIITSCRR